MMVKGEGEDEEDKEDEEEEGEKAAAAAEEEEEEEEETETSKEGSLSVEKKTNQRRNAIPWQPGMSKYVGVSLTSNVSHHWEARLKFRRETAPTLEDAEEYYELMARELGVDLSEPRYLRPGFVAASAASPSAAGAKRPASRGRGRVAAAAVPEREGPKRGARAPASGSIASSSLLGKRGRSM